MNDYETVYTFPNGFAREAEVTYLSLRHYNLNPRWGPFAEGGLTIQLPACEVPCLRMMQRANPARFGNAPKDKEP